jgi:hypothetical protein
VSRVAHAVAFVHAAVVAGLLAGCGGSGSEASFSGGTSAKSVKLSESTWHDGAWPFTFASGVLGCTKPPFPGQVTLEVGARIYGLNRSALDQGFQSARSILRSAPVAGGKMGVGAIVERGLKLCEEAS